MGFNAAGMDALRKLSPCSQLLYGSDEPFNSTVQMSSSLQSLGFTAGELRAIQHDNAVRLFPRLQT